MTGSPRADASGAGPLERLDVQLSELTTLRLGGQARAGGRSRVDSDVSRATRTTATTTSGRVLSRPMPQRHVSGVSPAFYVAS